MAQPTGNDYQNEVYIRTKFGLERGKGPRITLSQGIALFLEDLEFPIEIPDRLENPCAQYGITDYIVAKINENLFFWLTTDEITNDDNYQKTTVSFLPDGITTSFPGSRLHKSELPGVVRVIVQSTPTMRAMDVAQRLWSLFFADPAFEAHRKKYGEDGLLLDISEPDLVVHRCFPMEEPYPAEIVQKGRTDATFRLQLHYSRST